MRAPGPSDSRTRSGSIETGKRADLILVDRDRVQLAPDADPWSTLVYAARGTDVRMTMVDGEILVDGFELTRQDAPPSLQTRSTPPGNWRRGLASISRSGTLKVSVPELSCRGAPRVETNPAIIA